MKLDANFVSKTPQIFVFVNLSGLDSLLEKLVFFFQVFSLSLHFTSSLAGSLFSINFSLFVFFFFGYHSNFKESFILISN